MADDQGQEAIVINWRLDSWFPELNKDVLAKFKLYHESLLKFNKSLNLIPSKTIASADAGHFAESILACRIIASAYPQMTMVHDLGSGNGFPGIVFAVLFPKVQVCLVEHDAKKCEFLKYLITTLKVENATIFEKNYESLPETSIEFAMARGLATISKTILNARKVFKKGGKLFHLKAEEWGLELSEIPTQLCSVWTPSLLADYKLPVGSQKFAVVQTEKIA